MDSTKNEDEVDDDSAQPNDEHRFDHPCFTIFGMRFQFDFYRRQDNQDIPRHGQCNECAQLI